MALAKPVGIASIIGGIALLMLAFAVGTNGGTAFAGEDGTPTVANGDTTTTPTTGAGGISTPTPVGGGGGAVSTPTTGAGGGATTPPDTGTGPGSSDASLLWLLGAAALAAGAGAVLVGTRQRG